MKSAVLTVVDTEEAEIFQFFKKLKINAVTSWRIFSVRSTPSLPTVTYCTGNSKIECYVSHCQVGILTPMLFLVSLFLTQTNQFRSCSPSTVQFSFKIILENTAVMPQAHQLTKHTSLPSTPDLWVTFTIWIISN